MALIGARGLSEYWARSANFDVGANSHLSRGELTGAVGSKKISIVVAVRMDSTASDRYVLDMNNSAVAAGFALTISGDGDYAVIAENAAEANILVVTGPNQGVVGDWFVFMMSADLADSGSRAVFVNNASASPSWSTYTDDLMDLTYPNVNIGKRYNAASYMDGDIGFLYMVDDDLGFDDEETRLLFVDALGFPVPLQQSIDDGLIPEGLIRMGFEDVDDLGANLGTGGDFTENGTITAGADVNV